MLDGLTRPYQIPYRVMAPETLDGLLAPVAAPATHVAYSTIRLEPMWMALGQVAGVAAHLAVAEGIEPRKVAIKRLERTLAGQGQAPTYFKDIGRRHPAFAAF